MAIPRSHGQGWRLSGAPSLESVLARLALSLFSQCPMTCQPRRMPGKDFFLLLCIVLPDTVHPLLSANRARTVSSWQVLSD